MHKFRYYGTVRLRKTMHQWKCTMDQSDKYNINQKPRHGGIYTEWYSFNKLKNMQKETMHDKNI